MKKILMFFLRIWSLLPRYYGSMLRERMAGQGTKPEAQSSLVTQPMPRINSDAISWIVAQHKSDPEEIATIVVTNVTRVGIVLRCRYRKQWHLLVSPEDWQRVKDSSVPKPLSDDSRTPFIWLAAPPFSGVPVVESDELGRRILSAAITAQNLAQNKARLN